jgi:hypothetical protein
VAHSDPGSVRLGQGAYIVPGLDDVGEARSLFFQTVEQEAQPVLRALRDRLLGEYQRCRAAYGAAGRAPVTFPWPDGLRSDLAAFAQDFHLTANGKVPRWVFLQIEETLRMWSVCPSLGQGDPLSLGGVVGYPSTDTVPHDGLRIDLPELSWHPRKGHETRQQAKCRMLAEVESAIDSRTGEEGLRPTPSKKREHFVWAVQFQLLERPLREFPGCDPASKHCSPTRRKVEVAIKDTLNLIGLTRRTEKTGRPRNPRNCEIPD